MSWIREAAEDEPGGAVAAAFEKDRATRGYVANLTRLLANRPAVLDAWIGLNGAIKASMSSRRYELATLAAALRLRSTYCALAHGSILAEHHVGAEAVREAAEGHDTVQLSPIDRAVMDLADKVAAGAADMTESDLTELRDLGLDDGEILDVILAASARCFFSSVLDSTGTQADAVFQDLDPALRDALTVGRPIAAPDPVGRHLAT
ncbi:peroxidase [Oerskovia sp. NPDC060287]|uniref:peroxidase n=1 Tax=Oerskovia sp. NPDC060287 TaxID=3347095 RepID=UPI003653ADAC